MSDTGAPQMSPIEVMAEALAKHQSPRPWADMNETSRDIYRAEATAALLAPSQMEPTPGMIRAGRDAYDKAMRVPLDGPIESCFRAMLAAAVKEGNE